MGWPAALAVLLLGSLGFNYYHLRNIDKLVSWSRRPIGTPVPNAWGIWDYAFADLSHRSKTASNQREQLIQALARFREASQAMPDGVIFLAEGDCIEWINLTAAQHFGLDAARDLGQPVTNLVRHPDFVRYIESHDFSGRLVFHPARNDGIILSVQAIPFGKNLHLILSRDISRFERLETMRRDFVANVSHELKTPLTVVSGFLETLLDALHEISPDDSRHYLRLALEQSGRMQRLIDDLLVLSGLETGAPLPSEERIDAHGLVKSVKQEAELLSNGRHKISVDLGEKATLLGSHKELHSAFANLASNAVRYTPDTGKIRLIWHINKNGEGEFSVQDTGIGIDAQHIPRLTERFYRVDRGRSRETGGTGLGLAIVKHILTRHQATLEIVSESGKGSCFTARLPAKRVQRTTAPEQSLSDQN